MRTDPFRRHWSVSALALLIAVSGATARAADVPASVYIRNARGAMDVTLTGRQKNSVYARPANLQAGMTILNADDIEAIQIQLDGAALAAAEYAVRAGKLNEAVTLYRQVVAPVLPYLDIRSNNAIAPAFRYAELLRMRALWGESIKIYRALQNAADLDTRQAATAWDAYTLTKQGDAEAAAKVIESLAIDDPRHLGFVAASLARARIALARNEDEAALDWSARAAALGRLDNPLYSETLLLTAECYERMARKAPAKLRQSSVTQTSDGEVRQPPMTASEFAAVARSIYTQITVLFPKTEPSQIAADRLSAEAEQAPAPAQPLSPGDPK
ncbi:MAG: hypothetical protein H3C50_02985 [Kiritimatiellae bacterium]|nr:hypothetical protein [Kiritimatiellia bacterium]MCO5067334.1 hypothetical protein [Kiritimatiellia bacterium]